MSALPDLAGRLVLVTGAASGIGLACAEAFARRGARLVLVDREASALGQAQARAEAGGAADVLRLGYDLADQAAVDAMALRVAAEAGTPDVLVNNAGVYALGGFVETPPEQWQRLLQVNVMGMVRTIQAFLPAMRADGRARRIVNLGSLASFVGAPNLSAYTASKHAVLGLSEVLMMELREAGSAVGVTLVCPGIVNTPLLHAPAAASNMTARQLRQQAAYYRRAGCAPEVVAEALVAAVRRGDTYCLVGPKARLGFWGSRLSRGLAREGSRRSARDNGYLDRPD